MTMLYWARNDYYFFLFLSILKAAKPAKPMPNIAMVAGSGLLCVGTELPESPELSAPESPAMPELTKPAEEPEDELDAEPPEPLPLQPAMRITIRRVTSKFDTINHLF